MKGVIVARAQALAWRVRDSRLCWGDLADLVRPVVQPGRPAGDPLARLGVRADELGAGDGTIRLVGATRYLNDARVAVTHSIDDTTPEVRVCLDVLDTYGIKATVFVSTGVPAIARLWPRLRRAARDGHEVGAHSRRHPCRTPETLAFCFRAMSRYELDGSRRDILEHTDQSHVWTWAYPCGNCADRRFAQRKVALAGYLVARVYPGERHDRHLVPDLKTYDANPFAARYTQAVQNGYTTTDGVAVSGRTNVKALNEKFDEVYAAGGIYSFISHPQWIEYGPNGFYERHLAHVGGRDDAWYVPMGPLYAYRVLRAQTSVVSLTGKGARARFAVVNRLDPRIYNGSVTLEFHTTASVCVIARGSELPERAPAPVDRWDGEYVRRTDERLWLTIRPNTVVEFR
ncbi:MAG TPA: polysaccharide deacetylase family protein [bacterium]|nr:polysaccharide deacetylase family protein [bacterium]